MRIGSLFGIPFVVNPFFFLFLFIATLYGYLPEALVLFSVVLLHELSHVLVVKCYGLSVTEIELLPFGGVARIDELLQLNPPVEARVAVAGPVCNLLLAAAARVITLEAVPSEWLHFFVQINIVMAVFNLLPALPLDGGRMLRSYLVFNQGFRTATERAAGVGKFLAAFLVLLGTIGMYLHQTASSMMLLVVGLFLFGAARKERASAVYIFMRYLTRKKQELRLQRVMGAKELVASVETSIGEVLHKFSPPNYHVVWVVDLDGQPLGIVTEIQIINGLLEKGIHGKLSELIDYRLQV